MSQKTQKKIIYSRYANIVNICTIVLSCISKKLCHEPWRWCHLKFIRIALRFAQIFFRYETVSFCSLSVSQRNSSELPPVTHQSIKMRNTEKREKKNFQFFVVSYLLFFTLVSETTLWFSMLFIFHSFFLFL
jgi:hypothetical protein